MCVHPRFSNPPFGLPFSVILLICFCGISVLQERIPPPPRWASSSVNLFFNQETVYPTRLLTLGTPFCPVTPCQFFSSLWRHIPPPFLSFLKFAHLTENIPYFTVSDFSPRTPPSPSVLNDIHFLSSFFFLTLLTSFFPVRTRIGILSAFTFSPKIFLLVAFSPLPENFSPPIENFFPRARKVPTPSVQHSHNRVCPPPPPSPTTLHPA